MLLFRNVVQPPIKCSFMYMRCGIKPSKYGIQWNLWIMDTLGLTKWPDYEGVLIFQVQSDALGPLLSVQIMQVSLFSSVTVCILISILTKQATTLTWALIVSLVARQFLHFRSENPTPILNPPIECAAWVSASMAKTAPLTRTSLSLIVSRHPCNQNNHDAFTHEN